MSKAPYDGADLVKLRKAATKLAKDGDLPPRINMSLPDKRNNKIPVFELTRDPEFDLNGCFLSYLQGLCFVELFGVKKNSSSIKVELSWLVVSRFLFEEN